LSLLTYNPLKDLPETFMKIRPTSSLEESKCTYEFLITVSMNIKSPGMRCHLLWKTGHQSCGGYRNYLRNVCKLSTKTHSVTKKYSDLKLFVWIQWNSLYVFLQKLPKSALSGRQKKTIDWNRSLACGMQPSPIAYSSSHYSCVQLPCAM